MNKNQRLLGFFSSMLITFGITGLNMEEIAFQHNQLPYIAIGLGVILLIIFFWSKFRN